MNKIGLLYRPIVDILQDFKTPVSPELISHKPIFKRYNGELKKVGEVDYIHWYVLIDELERISPGWSFEIRTQFLPDRCVIEGRLTIRAAEGEFFREATGVECLDSDGYGDPVYSAESSALRRAMAKFGYALDLWRKDTKVQSQESTVKKTLNSELSTTNSIKTIKELNQTLVTQKQIAMLYAIAKKESGLADEDLKAIIKTFGYESTKEIKQSDFDSVLAAIKTAGRFLTIAQRKELTNWWRNEQIHDGAVKTVLERTGYNSTASIPRDQINSVKSAILDCLIEK